MFFKNVLDRVFFRKTPTSRILQLQRATIFKMALNAESASVILDMEHPFLNERELFRL